jgi:hypothetical protein
MNDVKTVDSGALAIPADMMAELAKHAKDAAAAERPAVSRISLKSGVMTFQGNPMPGNKTEAVILAAAFRNVWYAGRYDPNNIVSPNCFALSDTDEDMVPHENVTDPPNPTCAGCKYNEWKSDPNGGKGKACKQTRRLVVLPGHAVEQGLDAVKTAELAVIDLPVTSVKNYSSFVNALAASANVPPWAAVSQISVVPDAKTQFKVMFQPMRVLPSLDIVNAVKARLEFALRLAMQPYEATGVPVDGNDQVILKDGKPVEAAPTKTATKKF